jgi:pimeloyl-ACP methyl ester carboxylesterase
VTPEVHTRDVLLRLPVVLTAVTIALALGGCGGDEPTATPDERSSSTGDSPAPTDSADGGTEPPTGGTSLTCVGTGSPTVVFEAGLNTSGGTFESLAARVAEGHRACMADRAGIGDSPPLTAADPDPWPGSSADDLAEALEAAGEEPPYVVVGWSYGGMVAQAFATRHADLTGGLVLEDSSVPEQFEGAAWRDIAWDEGGRTVDGRRTRREIGTVDFRDLPVVVLTQDQLPMPQAGVWDRFQDRLAASSTNSLHVRAVDSPHEIHLAAEELVLLSIDEVAAAVGDGTPLSACDDRFGGVGGRCLKP